MEQLWQSLGQPGQATSAPWASLASPPVVGTKVVKAVGLFPKDASTVDN
jgi:hypothetical protein